MACLSAVDPALTLPIRFSTDPSTVFLPALQRNYGIAGKKYTITRENTEHIAAHTATQ